MNLSQRMDLSQKMLLTTSFFENLIWVYESLIKSWFNIPNAQIYSHTFRKRFSFTWGSFFTVYPEQTKQEQSDSENTLFYKNKLYENNETETDKK